MGVYQRMYVPNSGGGCVMEMSMAIERPWFSKLLLVLLLSEDLDISYLHEVVWEVLSKLCDLVLGCFLIWRSHGQVPKLAESSAGKM